MRDFKTIPSLRNREPAHIVSLEASALLLYVRWLLRTASNHGKRTPVLIDAQAVVGAVAKGRSSAPGLRRTLRRLAAHLLAGDMILKPIYVPSEMNPADGPSRGVR